MDVELSAETAALAAALTEKDPVTALAGAKLALNSGAEADAALQALDAAQLSAFFHYTAAQRGSAGSACPKLELFELVLRGSAASYQILRSQRSMMRLLIR